MEKLEKFGGQTPLGRPGQPAELGSIYVQLAAADASYATGQVYGSAGGTGSPDYRLSPGLSTGDCECAEDESCFMVLPF